jgi:hypothetical protein
VAVINSHSIIAQRAQARSFDTDKKIFGHKRNIAVAQTGDW